MSPLRRLLRSREGVALGVALGVCALVLGIRTFYRNAEYATAVGMAQTVADRWPSGTAEFMLGTDLRHHLRRRSLHR